MAARHAAIEDCMTTDANLKAIETKFDGHRFRSRTEARWAVFFRELGLTYEYEPEGYVLPGGECYLPDFWLPQIGVWFEVKPSYLHPMLDWQEIEKCRLMCIAKQQDFLIACGAPNHGMEGQIWFMYYNEDCCDAMVYADSLQNNYFPLSFRNSHDGLGIGCFLCPAQEWEVPVNSVKQAYERAAYARFEHGETP
jgi:hypothetical protein